MRKKSNEECQSDSACRFNAVTAVLNHDTYEQTILLKFIDIQRYTRVDVGGQFTSNVVSVLHERVVFNV